MPLKLCLDCKPRRNPLRDKTRTDVFTLSIRIIGQMGERQYGETVRRETMLWQTLYTTTSIGPVSSGRFHIQSFFLPGNSAVILHAVHALVCACMQIEHHGRQ
eukprot:scpid112218/ scgid26733/ 